MKGPLPAAPTMMRPLFRSSRAALRRGFTLIELLAVILIIGILAAFLLPQIPAAINRAKVTACQKNLDSIYQALLSYYGKYSDVPALSGAKFVASPILRGVWENTTPNAKKLTCPGVNYSALPNLAGKDPDEWFADADAVDGGSTSYAGRDMARFPLRKFPGSGTEALVADDNDGGKNHDTETNVLFADGTVQSRDLITLRDKGVLGEDEILLVGPDSQLEELQKLSLD